MMSHQNEPLNPLTSRLTKPARDKPDECSAALKAQDVRATQVLIAGRFEEIFISKLVAPKLSQSDHFNQVQTQ